jgi:hypothetical protein
VRSLSDIIRFFAVVPPVSRMMTATFGVVVAVDAALLVIEPTLGARAMRPILLLQAFAAASGFTVPARRGHYDLLLSRGYRRGLVALVHCAMASTPGVAGWEVLAAVDTVVAPPGRAALATIGTMAALFVVSAVAWALTAPLPRFAGAVGWLLLLALLSMLPADGLQSAFGAPPAGSWSWRALRALVAPDTMVGVRWTDGTGHLWPALAVAVAWLALAVARIEREDFRLDAGQ